MRLGLCLLIFSPLLFAGEPTLVYLVRHAEKVDASKDPELSERGVQRAEELASFFEKVPVDALYTSQYIRTKKTLAPLAKQQKLKARVIDAGTPQVLVDEIRSKTGQTILIAGHSNTVPGLIKMLGGPSVAIADSEYRDLFLLILDESVTFQRFRMAP